MDSIYEIPRTALAPTLLKKVPTDPTVPEVSMIFQSNPKKDNPAINNMYLSYSAWRGHNQGNINITAKPGCCMKLPEHTESKIPVNSGDLQNACSNRVRFESPVVVQKEAEKPLENFHKQNADLPVKSNKFTKPFEQIYMANIPNRHLDLSIIDAPKFNGYKENAENMDPDLNRSSNLASNKHDKFSTRNTRNVSSYSNGLTINNRSDINKNQYDAHSRSANGSTISNIKEKLSYNSEKVKDCRTSDVIRKNCFTDMLNYNCDNLKPLHDTPHRCNLDNAKNLRNYKVIDENTQTNIHAAANVYESFTSHNCINNCTCEHSLNKHAFKKSQGNDKINREIDVVNKNEDEPTVKDLLKIIQQQNEQLLILQQQVTTLLNNRGAVKQIQAAPLSNANVNVFGEQYRTSTQLESQENLSEPAQNFLPKKGPLQQFSMDVMTSFEVSIRPQNINRPHKNIVNHPPKITEITETESDLFNQSRDSDAPKRMLNDIYNKTSKINDTLKNTDVSLTFNEPVQVRETCPSPVNSVEIQMQDYSFDSDQEDTSGVGWTFYNNMMHQVNHILKKSGIETNNAPLLENNETAQNPIKQNIMKKVKEATIKHLKSIGVHVPAMDDDDDLVEVEPRNMKNDNPKDVNFAVKQLLMKYLPDEQLAKITCTSKDNSAFSQRRGPIKRRPEFSFATVQYMQKYNLLNDGCNNDEFDRRATESQQKEVFDRILDITAIKQQPKLL